MNEMIKRNGAGLVLDSPERVKAFAEYVANTTMIPPQYRGKPQEIFCAIWYGMEIGMPPFQAIHSVAVINGRPSLWGDGLIALAVGHPDCLDFNEYIEGSGDEMVAYCEIKRRGRESAIVKSFSVQDAKTAGLWGKSGPWKNYPAIMLQQRATTFAIRRAFPDALMGFTHAQELKDIEDHKKDELASAGVVEVEAPTPKAEEPEPVSALEDEDDIPLTPAPASVELPEEVEEVVKEMEVVPTLTKVQQKNMVKHVDKVGVDYGQVIALFNKHGYKKCADIPAEKYGFFKQEISNLAKEVANV